MAALSGAPGARALASATDRRRTRRPAATARNAALRAALVDALTAIAERRPTRRRAARAPIAEHLGAQAMRDVAVLKPSMLSEISARMTPC